jgi:hypothetical protein
MHTFQSKKSHRKSKSSSSSSRRKQSLDSSGDAGEDDRELDDAKNDKDAENEDDKDIPPDASVADLTGLELLARMKQFYAELHVLRKKMVSYISVTK